MRIISGRHKGRQLTPPRKLPVRPTTDRAKEALFNILANRYYLPELRVADLYSGTGSIGFEFASRGVEHVTCVDIDPGCVRFISRTAKALDMPLRAIKGDALAYLQRTNERFDLIFADPPYALPYNDFASIPILATSHGLLSDSGTVIVEHASKMDLSGVDGFVENRIYGGTSFSFFGSCETQVAEDT